MAWLGWAGLAGGLTSHAPERKGRERGGRSLRCGAWGGCTKERKEREGRGKGEGKGAVMLKRAPRMTVRITKALH